MNPVAIIPVFNHGRTVGEVIDQVRHALPEIPLMVVNDGSSDGTADVLRDLEGAGCIRVLTQGRNQGKGAALVRAFKEAAEMGFSHALTVDADGQHHVPDAVRLLEKAREFPDDLIIGARDMDGGSEGGGRVPARSKTGRNLARYWLEIQTGQDIPDSQCGLRVYPIGHVNGVRCRFMKFDFETEILARLAWGGVTIRSVPVACIYFPPERRVSHFRPVMDTVRGVRVNIFLVTRRLVPVPFRRLVPRGKTADGAAAIVWWRPSRWREAILRMMRTGCSNAQLSAAIAVGVFIGLTPTFSIQTVLAAYVAQRLHMNIPATVLGSQISIPPLMPVWWFLSLQCGNLLLHGAWLTRNAPQLSAWSWANAMSVLGVFVLGSLLVAIFMGTASLFAARAALAVMRPGHASKRMTG